MRALYRVLLSLLLGSYASTAPAQGLTFGIVGKSVDDINFITTWIGCDKAAEPEGDQCILLGPGADAQLREQQLIIKDALASRRFDALAISVINSKLVANALADANIPIITFDSPLSHQYQHMSSAYVGIDNEGFGRSLAKIAKELSPKGGSVCFMSVEHDTNLAIRIQGARAEFSEQQAPSHTPLIGKWWEPQRCPWYTKDSLSRSLKLLKVTLDAIQPDVFLSLGHWPLIDKDAYIETVHPHKARIQEKKTHILVGIGDQSLPDAEALMQEGLLHGYVSINFSDIGKMSYDVMKKLVNNTLDNQTYHQYFVPNNITVIAPTAKPQPIKTSRPQ